MNGPCSYRFAVSSWGSEAGEPMLVVHGRLDSMSTFVPLLQLMPRKYYYVSVDMPGNGRSDPLPFGVKLSRLHFVAAVEVVVKSLGWQRFIYMGHSMGCEHGLLYNAIYPGAIKNLILLDVGPLFQTLHTRDPEKFYHTIYDSYYSNYDKVNRDYKLYTKEKAIQSVMQARGLTETQADLILSRNFIEVGNELFRLSWDNRLKTLAPQNLANEYYFELFSKNAPPILVIAASDSTLSAVKGMDGVNQLQKLVKNLKDFSLVTVEGGHDVHFTHPHRCAGYIHEFLDKDYGKSKL